MFQAGVLYIYHSRKPRNVIIKLPAEIRIFTNAIKEMEAKQRFVSLVKYYNDYIFHIYLISYTFRVFFTILNFKFSISRRQKNSCSHSVLGV